MHDQLDAQARHRLTVEEFLMLDQQGAFGDRRTELFEGEVYYMSPKHRPHARAVTQLVIALSRALEAAKSQLSVLSDISVRLTDHDVPEPDIVITDDPEGEGILPLASVRLVIEVADSTARTDLGLKATLYARGGVPEYWVLDLKAGRVHQMWSARGGAYAERRETPLGERIEAVTIAGLGVEVTANK